MPELTLKIDGMHCGSCVRRVSHVLAATDGMVVTEVRLGAARVTLPAESAPPDSVVVARAIAALAKAGYTAHLDQ